MTALIHTGMTVTPRTRATPNNARFRPGISTRGEHLRRSEGRRPRYVVANTWMRAPGESVGSFALESAIDELAYELKMDPIELRRSNEPEKDPTKGTPFSSRHLIEAYRARR